MSAETPHYVLDSFALLSFLQGEGGMLRIKALLKAAKHDICRVYLSWINLGEVMYITERGKGLRQARQTLARIQALPVEMLEVTSQAVLDAAHIKATRRLSYADAFAAVAALNQNATLLTGDPEFASIETTVKIEWLLKKP
jgi:predicted nucleic acid-binding protein